MIFIKFLQIILVYKLQYYCTATARVSLVSTQVYTKSRLQLANMFSPTTQSVNLLYMVCVSHCNRFMSATHGEQTGLWNCYELGNVLTRHSSYMQHTRTLSNMTISPASSFVRLLCRHQTILCTQKQLHSQQEQRSVNLSTLAPCISTGHVWPQLVTYATNECDIPRAHVANWN